jgi:hypothetical protein
MRDLAGPAVLDGASKTPMQLRDISTGRISNIAAGRFHTAVPQGEYELTAGSLKRRIIMLPGQSYSVDFDDVEFTLAGEKNASGVVTLRAVATGTGHHTITLRTDNLPVEAAVREVDLKTGVPQTIEWQARPSSDAPWVAVAVPDRQISRRKELTGR